jgi:hypothetical protein
MTSGKSEGGRPRAGSAEHWLTRLEGWKARYGDRRADQLRSMLARAGQKHFDEPRQLIRLHEVLLFYRAYPASPEVARLCDEALGQMAGRVAALRVRDKDLTALEEPDVSGIAGTGLTAVFGYEVACRLSRRYPGTEIAWDAYDQPDLMGPVLNRLFPLVAEDWPVEAHPPLRQWLQSATPQGQTALGTLLARLAQRIPDPVERGALYDSLQAPLRWELGDAPDSRSRLRFGRGKLFVHQEPLLRRQDVSLEAELASPLAVQPVKRRDCARLIDAIVETSAMRYRELYGFSHPETKDVWHATPGRGLDIYFFGVPAERRLPLRAYHSGMFFKNGVPAGYVEVLSLFDRAEVGFNLYYTFRDGESAWIYAQLLRLFHHMVGVNTFSVDPYQLGHENAEAIQSGAFWFYRKLGFRPVEPDAIRALAAEERRMRKAPEARSTPATLQRLAEGCMVYEAAPAQKGMWDRLSVRNIGFAVQRECAERHLGDPQRMSQWAATRIRRILGCECSSPLAVAVALIEGLEDWSREEKSEAVAILRAKQSAPEIEYLRLMQRHRRLWAALLLLGTRPK